MNDYGISGTRPFTDGRRKHVDKVSEEMIRDGVSVLVARCHGASRESGWYTDVETGQPKTRNVGEMLCLIHSEISEAMEGYRKSLPDDKLPGRSMIEVELADAVIRIADLAGYLRFDLGAAILEKMTYNAVRQDHKIESRALAGGKQF